MKKERIENLGLKVAAAVSLLPLAAWPMLAAHATGPSWMLTAYPVVTVLYAALAVGCARERQTLAWILVVMSLLTSAAVWML